MMPSVTSYSNSTKAVSSCSKADTPLNLKRTRPSNNENQSRKASTFHKRQCLADIDDSDSPSCSSGDEHIDELEPQNTRNFKSLLGGINSLTHRRAMSLNCVAPATANNIFSSSPRSSHLIDENTFNHSRFNACYTNSEDEHDDNHEEQRRVRNKSISVAALRRHRTATNPETLSIAANDNCSIGINSGRKRRSPAVPRFDLTARAKCFDYLVSAIDEVWAQYCTYTSCAEDELYAVDEDEKVAKTHRRHVSVYSDHELPTSPASLCDEDGNYSSANESYGPRTPYHNGETSSSYPRQMYNFNRCNTILDGYSDSNGDCTISDDNFMKTSAVSDKSLAPSEQPGSVRLLNLKQRLMNAKYYLQDLVDRDDIESSASFWNRWDLVKYSAIELVEEDGDDDDIVENVTEELEEGRYYANIY